MTAPAEQRPLSPKMIAARIERIDVWALSYLFIGIIGTGFLFTFYDIFDINVSFVQTCVQIKPGCTPPTALDALTVPVALNLAGYVIGTLILSPLSDTIGRRNMLLITMLITGLGSLYNAVAPGYTNFVIARVITGIGIGADLAIVNTYLGEVAPRRGRARYTAVIFTMSALGAFFGIWGGLLLTTPAEKWPLGLPFALAGPGFENGWRWMYGIGALLALIGIVMRFELPESPRWLAGRGRLDEADAVVTAMEKRASRHGPLPEPDLDAVDAALAEPVRLPASATYRELFRNPLYVRRIVVLLVMWFTAYITVYSYGAGFTSVLTGLKYPPPEAGVITAMGVFGFLIQGVFTSLFVEKLQRRHWLPVGAVVTLAGAVLVAEAGTTIAVAFIGSMLIFFGFNVWVSPAYALTSESFPTRARTTGFGLVDGVGHLGGGIGVLLIAPYVKDLSVLGALILISAFLVVASIVVQFTEHTRARQLDSISP
jgi:MFS transporter, putative metabolite:H+ symporter